MFDSKNNAIPVAWIITPRFACREAHRWLRLLHDRVHSKDPNWKLGGFITDDPLTDIHTIRFVIGTLPLHLFVYFDFHLLIDSDLASWH